MNGKEILRVYAPNRFELHYGGFCELHTAIAYLSSKVSKEDKEILKSIGWKQIEPFTWKFEWWD